jgi:predicted transcriptional regulator
MFKRGVFDKLARLGYHVIPIRKSAFDAVSESQMKCTILLTGVGQANKACLQKARVMANISRITEKEAVLFIDRRLTRENIGGMAIIGKDELKHIQDEDKILQLIQARSRGK